MTIETIVLAAPRGFCAGVERAILIVERALEKFGAPIYVKHEIVHNKHVVDTLKEKGVIFVEDLETVPKGSTLIFSAHGVSSAIENQARERSFQVIDASCPLVKKVHREVSSYDKEDHEIVLIGHTGHAEIEGTAGRVAKARITLVQTPEDARNFQPKNPEKMMLATQTTLSMDDTKEICDILQDRFPILKENSKNDICYATQNRQNAIKGLIKEHGINFLLVVGSQNSSNSNRLKDIGPKYNIPSKLVASKSEIDTEWFKDKSLKIGISAGASSPEVLITEVVEFLKNLNPDHGPKVVHHEFTKEEINFNIPKIVRVAGDI